MSANAISFDPFGICLILVIQRLTAAESSVMNRLMERGLSKCPPIPAIATVLHAVESS